MFVLCQGFFFSNRLNLKLSCIRRYYLKKLKKTLKFILIPLFLFLNGRETEIEYDFMRYVVELLSSLYCLSKLMSRAYTTDAIT